MSQYAAEQERKYTQLTYKAALKTMRKPFRRWWVHQEHFHPFSIKAYVYEDEKGWRWWFREAWHCIKQLRHPSEVLWREYPIRKELMPGVSLRILNQHAEPEPGIIGLYVNGECVATIGWKGVNIRQTEVIYSEEKQAEIDWWDGLIQSRQEENDKLYKENRSLEEQNSILKEKLNESPT